MTKFNLTTKLNLKIVSIVVLLIITVTTYNHLLSFEEENKKNVKRLRSITDYIISKKPDNFFYDKAIKQRGTRTPLHEQIVLLNQELQPILDDLFLPVNTIKFGFYSLEYDSIVALGPKSDLSLSIGIAPTNYTTIYQTDTEQLIENENSILWHGAKSLTYFKAIKEHDVTVAYAFASYNQNAVSELIWKRTINTFLGAFLMLLVCIIIFRELFIKLQKDLQSFAESIVTDQPYNCEVAELAPILRHISEQTENMTRLDRLNIIGEMAAGIAHEIRNPMTTVRGLLQFIGNKEEFSQQKSNFDLMINELDRANSIITEFLSLAKNSVMEFSENNLNTIVEDLFPLLQADALCNNCEVKLQLTTLPNICVDSSSIRQLILNLVRNGLDAIPNEGIITISTKVSNDKLSLSIHDSGIGIPPEVIAKLGTPFFTTKEQGTGLGLAICYRIAHRHDALLNVESEVGKGTSFTITFNHG